MAEINESIYLYLSTYAALTSLVGTRIYQDGQKQKTSYTYPYITYSLVSEEEVETLQTPSNNLMGPIYEFNIFATTRPSAAAVAKQIRKAFKNFNGVMGTGGVTVSAVEKISHSTDDLEGAIFSDSQEFQIWHYET